jgi:hypothetical protein
VQGRIASPPSPSWFATGFPILSEPVIRRFIAVSLIVIGFAAAGCASDPIPASTSIGNVTAGTVVSPRVYLRDSAAASAAVDTFLAALRPLADKPVKKADALSIASRLEAPLIDARFWFGRLGAERPDDARLVSQRDALKPQLDGVLTAMEAVHQASVRGDATALVSTSRTLRSAVTQLREATVSPG